MESIEEIGVYLSDPQEAIIACRQVDILDMAGQGGGKSHLIGLITGMKITTLPRVRGFIGANTYDQLSGATLRVAFEVWRTVYGMTEYSKDNPGGAYVVDKQPPAHFQKFIKLRKYANVISFWNGCIVFIGSLDNYMSQDGKEYGWAHLDETKDTKEEAVKDVIKGRLRQIGMWYDADGNIKFEGSIAVAQAKGWTSWTPLYIHTSPASGLVKWVNEWFGLESDRELIKKKVLSKADDFYYNENNVKKCAAIIYSAYHNAHNMAPGYLENREASFGPERTLKLIHGYPFAKSGGEYFPGFNRLQHVRKFNYNPQIPTIHFTWDFNVVPYITCLASQMEYVTRYLSPDRKSKSDAPQIGWTAIDVLRIWIFKEYCLSNPENDVKSVCGHIVEDFPPGTTEAYLYGDATGKIRKPGLGQYTDFGAIKELLWQYIHNESDRAPRQNMAPGIRRQLVNDILAGRIPEIELIISDECEILIQDMEEVKQAADGSKKKPKKEDENTKEKYEYLGHTSDALEYLVAPLAKEYVINNAA